MPAEPDYDVFVSYAHADNGVPVGSSVGDGWVTALAANLNEGPNVFKKRLFIDHQLKPGDEFSADLLDKVARSSLLVLLLSQNYVDSRWCGKELDHFIRTRFSGPDQPQDVFVVELFPYERLIDVPAPIQSLRKRLIHAKFWFQQRDAAEPGLAGYPSARECGAEGRDHYWKVLNELRGALDARLREGRTRSRQLAGDAAAAASASGRPPRRAPGSLGTVLLADTTDDLEAQRNAVRIALQAEGALVVPAGDFVGLSPQEFESALTADLARADLFVQLLSPTVGRKGKGFAAPLPQMQHQRAVVAGLPILQWCERLPFAGQIVDPGHARLFETDTLRATNLAEFKSAVIERLRADAARRAQESEAARLGPPVALAHQPQIFFDDIAAEPALSARLRAVIRAQDYAVRSLPPGAPLGNNGVDVKELLRPCLAGITLYTDRSKYAIAYNRLVYFLNQVADGNLPLARWGVVLRDGTVAGEFGIESDEVVAVDEQGLASFLQALQR